MTASAGGAAASQKQKKDQRGDGGSGGGGDSGEEEEAARQFVFSCSYAEQAANLFGMYGLKKEDVVDALSGKRVGLSARLQYYCRRLSADCSPVDLEVQLRLM